MWTPTEEEKYGVVICSFRGSVPQGLVLEIGETVQILEKCEVPGSKVQATAVKIVGFIMTPILVDCYLLLKTYNVSNVLVLLVLLFTVLFNFIITDDIGSSIRDRGRHHGNHC